ncbi:MAG: GatB/YqeY domain-containing protein [Deltaproteobacteria bacterium]|nr:GatB/YqeY domain-containing protein [Deltaproteobacteria bacterium]
MTLKEQIAKDSNEALKARDERKLSALRLLRTEIKKREVSGQKKELSDAEVMEAISTLVKQRRESIRLFQQGQRQDLVEKEEAELQYLLSYLPQSLSQQEIEALIEQVIGETQATGLKDQGKVMKGVMAKIAGRAEGKIVSEIVKQKLSKPAS